LVDKKIEAGKKLIEALDADGLVVRSAFWHYDSESDRWQLIIASPQVNRDGRIKVYERIRATLERSGITELSLSDLMVVREDDQLVGLLRAAVTTGPGITDIRFTRNVIHGVFIEDAHIYRST
jgi:hypothetical protein